MPNPHTRSKVWEAPNRAISKSGKYRSHIVANGDSHPSAAFHDREKGRNLRSRLWAADVDPVLPTQCHRTHRILRKIVAQLKFRIFQESCKFPPQCERVSACSADCA